MIRTNSRTGKAIAFATLGSLGDLYPCLALASELKSRKHNVKIITTEFYRSRVEQAGIAFSPMRRDWEPTDSNLIGKCENLRSGPEVLFRKLILPHLRSTYEDLLSAVNDVDLLVAGELVYAAPLVAEKLNLRWASLILSPCSFFSAHDPSVLVNAPALIHLRRSSTVHRLLLDLARVSTRHWWNPVRTLRKEEGLRRQCDPLMKDKFSPDLVLALFSEWLAPPQPDWPKQTVQPGFVFYDGTQYQVQARQSLINFFESGDQPILFTLGSTAANSPGDFYRTSIEASLRLGSRAVLVGGTTVVKNAAPNILWLPYAPYSEVFLKSSVIVHQGGSGTIGQALAAGRPMLVVPWGWDQPDNGARVERRGAAICIPKEKYTTEAAIRALHRLSREKSFAFNASKAAAQVRRESGLREATDRIEDLLR